MPNSKFELCAACPQLLLGFLLRLRLQNLPVPADSENNTTVVLSVGNNCRHIDQRHTQRFEISAPFRFFLTASRLAGAVRQAKLIS